MEPSEIQYARNSSKKNIPDTLYNRLTECQKLTTEAQMLWLIFYLESASPAKIDKDLVLLMHAQLEKN